MVKSIAPHGENCAGMVVAPSPARLDLRWICQGILAEHDFQRTVIMLSVPALRGAMLGVDVLEEVAAGHGCYGFIPRLRIGHSATRYRIRAYCGSGAGNPSICRT